MKLLIAPAQKRLLLLSLALLFVYFERVHISDFLSGLYDGAGGQASQAQ